MPADSMRLAVYNPPYTDSLPHYFQLDEARRCAKQQGKGLMLYFTDINTRSTYVPERDWFGNRNLLRTVNRHFIPVFLLMDLASDSGGMRRYQINNFGTNASPAVFFTDADGKELARCMKWKDGALENVVRQLTAP